MYYHTPDERGVTRYEDLEQVERQKGHPLPELENITDPPPGFDYIWNWFFELHGARQSGVSGPNPISYTEIVSWSTSTGISIESWEVTILKVMDREYMKFQAESHKQKRQSQERKRGK